MLKVSASPRVAVAAFVVTTIALLAVSAQAQYMYLDSNGNGVHDVGDRLRVCPTRIDVWLNTANNRDGSPASCAFGTGGLDLAHYEFVFQAVGGTVTWGPMSNLIEGFARILARDARDTTGTVFYHNGAIRAGAALPPGLYKVATLTVTVATGSPRIDIISRHPNNGTGRTSFGSECPATALYDHTNRHGQTWTDVDGLSQALATDAPPRVTLPGVLIPQDGSTVTFGVTAIDLDADPIVLLTADLSALPLGNDAVFDVTGLGTTIANGTFTWTPTTSDSGDYAVSVTATNCLISLALPTIIHVIGTVSSVETPPIGTPNFLAPNEPNPFSPETSIDYSLSRESEVRVRIYSASGRVVRTLVDGRMPAGPHLTSWNGTDDAGRSVASGVYWCRLESGSFRMSRRMILLR